MQTGQNPQGMECRTPPAARREAESEILMPGRYSRVMMVRVVWLQCTTGDCTQSVSLKLRLNLQVATP